ncbi:hypothetical protein PCASD_24004 [Puccinia coronata f. sp. avenae]|uniref:Uncharacterized protein n=1 Tax=Puccinia coronata f. sp. avenae TaxID=200324 RepID=A0A2N5S408_9BASI|nr:hypothetical protein PCASD_24004 [Puccinia coronata f. sp. avenae]
MQLGILQVMTMVIGFVYIATASQAGERSFLLWKFRRSIDYDSGSHEEVPSASGLLALPQHRESLTSENSANKRQAANAENNALNSENQLKTGPSPESLRFYLKPSTDVGANGRGKYPDPIFSCWVDSNIKPPYSSTWRKPTSGHLQVGPSQIAGTPGYDTSSQTASALIYPHEITSQLSSAILNASPEAPYVPETVVKEAPIWLSKTQELEKQGKIMIYWFPFSHTQSEYPDFHSKL